MGYATGNLFGKLIKVSPILIGDSNNIEIGNFFGRGVSILDIHGSFDYFHVYKVEVYDNSHMGEQILVSTKNDICTLSIGDLTSKKTYQIGTYNNFTYKISFSMSSNIVIPGSGGSSDRENFVGPFALKVETNASSTLDRYSFKLFIKFYKYVYVV